MKPVLLLNLLMLVSSTLQTNTNSEHPTNTASIVIGQHTTEQRTKLLVSSDEPTLTPPPPLSNKLNKPSTTEFIRLTDKSNEPNDDVKHIMVKEVSMIVLNDNVEPSTTVPNQQHLPGIETIVFRNGTAQVGQDMPTSRGTVRGMDLVLMKRAVNKLVLMNATGNSSLSNTTQTELNSKEEEEIRRQFEEYKEATAKDPLMPCSLTVNQDLLNSTVIQRSYSDNTGDGYEFKYFAPHESFRHEVGVVKNPVSGNPGLEVRGYYIWYIYQPKSLFPLRYTYVTHYVANENGYQEEGEHIPGSKGKVPNKLPIDMVPCSDEEDRYGAAAPGLPLQEALLSGGK